MSKKHSHWFLLLSSRACTTRLFAFLFFCLGFITASFAQKYSATLDRDKILLGEQVTMQIKIEGIDTRLASIVQWLPLPDSLPHLTVVKKDNEDSVNVGGFTSFIQSLTVTSFDSGRWAIPLQPITIQDNVTGKKAVIKPDSLYLQVLAVDVSGLRSYHDLKDIIDVPVKRDYVFIIVSGIIAIAITILVILILKRRKRPAPIKKPVRQSGNPLNEALKKLEDLRKMKNTTALAPKEFYTKLDEIYRGYFNHRMQIETEQSTSDELIIRLSLYLQDKNAHTRFYQLLRLVDAVKFAKYVPAAAQDEDALVQAAESLTHIEKQLQLVRYGN